MTQAVSSCSAPSQAAACIQYPHVTVSRCNRNPTSPCIVFVAYSQLHFSTTHLLRLPALQISRSALASLSPSVNPPLHFLPLIPSPTRSPRLVRASRFSPVKLRLLLQRRIRTCELLTHSLLRSLNSHPPCEAFGLSTIARKRARETLSSYPLLEASQSFPEGGAILSLSHVMPG